MKVKLDYSRIPVTKEDLVMAIIVGIRHLYGDVIGSIQGQRRPVSGVRTERLIKPESAGKTTSGVIKANRAFTGGSQSRPLKVFPE